MTSKKVSRRELIAGSVTLAASATASSAVAENLMSDGVAQMDISPALPVQPAPYSVMVTPDQVLTQGSTRVVVDNPDFTNAFIKNQVGVLNQVRSVAGDPNLGVDSVSIDSAGRVNITSSSLKQQIDDIYGKYDPDIADTTINIWCDSSC